MYDVFISYECSDDEWVKMLAERLEKEQLKVFFDKFEVKPGQNFIEKLNEGLSQAHFFIIVLTPESVKAEWPTAERDAAIYQDPSGRLGRVIPIIRRMCKIPPLIAIRSYINFSDDKLFESKFKQLISVIKPSSPSTSVTTESIRSTAFNFDPTMPSGIKEEIYSNLFPVVSMPEDIWSLPTKFYNAKHVMAYLGWKSRVPPFIIKAGRLYTFVNLSNTKHAFVGITEDYDLQHEKLTSWFANEIKSKWLVHLLNVAMATNLRAMGMHYDKKVERFFFPEGVLKNYSVSWVPHVRKTAKELIVPRKDKNGRIHRYDHRSIFARFVVLKDKIMMLIDPGWNFTFDGFHLLPGRRQVRLSTKRLARQKNLQNFSETRFWAWLLSKDGEKIRFWLGGVELLVDVKPISVTINFGIDDDHKELPKKVEKPPEIIEDQSVEETDVLDLGDEQDE